jgi:hypothetical protein
MRPTRPRWRKLRLIALVNLTSFAVLWATGELAIRFLWNPKYYIRSGQWFVGSGTTAAGRKYWPNSTYRIESDEFRVTFRTNGQGYRARPGPPVTEPLYRVAFVGDSFTEGMQVEYERTFCALTERALAGAVPGREVVCENYGVASTDVFDYWHRITHDVLPPDPPDALVLCLYPGNDFQGPVPEDGFDPDGRPRWDYYHAPGWTKHVTTWLNLHSKLAFFLQLRFASARSGILRPRDGAPEWWWCDPEAAARAGGSPTVRRSRALLQAIAAECRRTGTSLYVLVVGPAPPYRATAQGDSPLGRIIADCGIDAPVIDAALAAAARPDSPSLLFPRDGHLNASGHRFVASVTAPVLRAAFSQALATSETSTRLR